ncbi:hypothetical protein DMENIID0001_028710 [Sergentomyia squamirostris]
MHPINLSAESCNSGDLFGRFGRRRAETIIGGGGHKRSACIQCHHYFPSEVSDLKCKILLRMVVTALGCENAHGMREVYPKKLTNINSSGIFKLRDVS